MLRTRMTEMLGIEYPIMLGGMQHQAVPVLAAAVSNAGGLGTINSTIYPEAHLLRAAIKEMKTLTAKPFCVNISMLPEANVGDMTAQYFEVCVNEGVAAIETAGRNPEEYLPIIRGTGIKLIHKVPSLKLAKKAEQIGADMVTIVGLEAGGHPGPEEVTSFILGNKVSREVKIPVLLGGGIADGRSMAAALALGAEGVVVGTRMLLTTESILHDNIKEALLSATEKDTILIQRSIRNLLRVYKNERAVRVFEFEAAYHPTLKELMPLIGGTVTREALKEGDPKKPLLALGQCIGLSNEIKPCKDVINEMVAEATARIKHLNEIFMANYAQKSWID